MKKEYDDELTPEQREKMRKNLVYVGIFSVVMIFAGLTSGYIVSMGDSFWVKYDFPPAFWISTVILAVSSIVLTVGIKLAQKGNHNAAKIGVTATFVLGVAFACFQYKGYGQLVDKGAHFTGRILVTQGRYGDYFQLKVDNNYLIVDGNDYLLAGKKVTDAQKADISAFAQQFENAHKKMLASVKNYGKYTLVYKNDEVSYKNGKFYAADTAELLFTDLLRLAEFSWHLRDGRGDFFLKGTIGKDFHLFYKGTELTYKNRTLFRGATPLSPPLQIKLNDAHDQATSYLYIITILHLLHVIFTLIYMLRMSIRSFTGRLAEHNYLSIRTGAIFWHFLGLLWGYLLLFLLFIH